MPQPPILFSDAAQRMLEGQTVQACFGVKLELINETLFLAQGTSFTDNAGQRWQGLGALGNISGVQVGPEAASSPVELTLSGLDSSLAPAARASNQFIRGGAATVYFFLFDQNFKPLDLPFAMQRYKLDNGALIYSGGDNSCVLRIRGEPVFAAKHISPLSLISDMDQQSKHPGDTIFERMGFKHIVVTQA